MKTLTDWSALHQDHFQNRRVLITGGAGFIGSQLTDALRTLGASVVILDDISTGRRDNLNTSDVELIEASILDADAVAKAAANCDLIFHEAAMASVPKSVAQPRAFYEVNVLGMLNVLEAARAAKVRRIIFAASSSAYGETQILPKIESMPTDPLSPYAATKIAGEAMLRAWAGSYGMETVSLRYFNIFGPRQRADSAYAAVIAAFSAAMLKGQRPIIYGDGEQSRDFTFVHNAVHANLLAARCPRPLHGPVINIATGQRITLNHLAAVMRKQLGREDLSPIYKDPRPGDVRHSLADLSLANDLIAYTPIINFETGLQATMEWYQTTQ